MTHVNFRSPTAALALILAGLVSACAPSPDSIAAVPMTGAFDSLGCAQARAELTAETANLASLEQRQRNAVTGDALGVFLIGVPVSSLSGNDAAGLIGVSKGRVLALQARVASC